MRMKMIIELESDLTSEEIAEMRELGREVVEEATRASLPEGMKDVAEMLRVDVDEIKSLDVSFCGWEEIEKAVD